MKNSLNYLKLWQKKRSELGIKDDMDADWLDMQSVLDQHLPLQPGVDTKRPRNFKILKLLPKFFIAFSAAAMVSGISLFVVKKVKQHDPKHRVEKVNKITTDSVADNIRADSLKDIGDSTAQKTRPDSIQTNNLPAKGNDKDSLSTNFSNKNLKKDSASVVKNNTPIVAIGNNKKVTPANNNSNTSAKATVQPDVVKHHSVSAYLHNKNISKLNKSPNNGGYNNGNYLPTKITTPDSTDQNTRYKSGRSYYNTGFEPLISAAPQFGIDSFQRGIITVLPDNIKPLTFKPANKNQKAKSVSRSAGAVNIDWGLLAGVTTTGSFTTKAQNNNFYGSLPVDLYFGLFATYNINNKWAINSQVQLYNPQLISTKYTHENESKVDSGQVLSISSSRKLYSISVPLNIVYKISDNIGLKAGPVISIPVKYTNGSYSLQPDGIKKDSLYYARINGILNQTKFQQKINFGYTAGLSINIKRFIIEGAYVKSLSGYQLTSGLGSYKSFNGNFQITVGFRLNKSKK